MYVKADSQVTPEKLASLIPTDDTLIVASKGNFENSKVYRALVNDVKVNAKI